MHQETAGQVRSRETIEHATVQIANLLGELVDLKKVEVELKREELELKRKELNMEIVE